MKQQHDGHTTIMAVSENGERKRCITCKHRDDIDCTICFTCERGYTNWESEDEQKRNN